MELKKSMSNIITNSTIDDIYNKELLAGASGGKLWELEVEALYFLFLLKKKLSKRSLNDYLHVPFKFDFSGSQIIYNSPENIIIW